MAGDVVPFPDKEFFAQLSQGHLWQCYVANFFVLQGLDVQSSPIVIRPSYQQRAGFDDHDLIVAGHSIEVKSRSVPFTSGHDVPGKVMPFFVDTVEKFHRKAERPLAYVIVSKATGAMLAVRSDPSHWSKVKDRDRTRNQVCEWYAAPRSRLRGIGSLVAHLRRFGSMSRSGGA